MKAERQGVDECCLATIAALTDHSLKDVRELSLFYATEYTNWKSPVTSWKTAIANSSMFWFAVEKVCAEYKLPYRLVNTGKMANYSCIPASSTIGTPELSDTGKGTITIQLTNKTQTTWHIMPFENGFIYNTNNFFIRPQTIVEVIKDYESNDYSVEIVSVATL